MKRLLKLVLIASASVGAAYLASYVANRNGGRSEGSTLPPTDAVDALSPEDQERLVRELSSMI